MQLDWLVCSEYSFGVFFLENLRRNLSEMHNLSLTALAIDLVLGLIQHVTVIFIGKIVINIVVYFSSFTSLFYTEEQVYPVIDG